MMVCIALLIHVPCQTNLVSMGYHRHLVEELCVEEQELKSCCSLVPSWSLGLGAAPWCAALEEHSSVYPCKVKIFGFLYCTFMSGAEQCFIQDSRSIIIIKFSCPPFCVLWEWYSEVQIEKWAHRRKGLSGRAQTGTVCIQPLKSWLCHSWASSMVIIQKIK